MHAYFVYSVCVTPGEKPNIILLRISTTSPSSTHWSTELSLTVGLIVLHIYMNI